MVSFTSSLKPKNGADFLSISSTWFIRTLNPSVNFWYYLTVTLNVAIITEIGHESRLK